MKKITTKLLMFAMVLTGISVLSSCKDYDEDKYYEQTQAQEALQQQIVEMQTTINNIYNTVGTCNCATWTPGADGWWYKNGEKQDIPCVGANGQDGNDGASDKWEIVFNEEDGCYYWYHNDENTNIKAVGTDGKDGNDGNDATVEIVNGYWVINGAETGIPATGADGNDGKDGKDADVWTIQKYDGDGCYYWYINGKKTEFKAVGKDGKDGKGLTPEQEQLLNDAIDLYERLNETAELYGYEDAADLLDALNDQVRKNKKAIEKAQKDIQDLKERMNQVEESLNKLVTGILVQSVENPAFGSFALPIDVNSKMLVAYYGKSANGAKFPTTNEGCYTTLSTPLCEADWNMISGMDQFVAPSGVLVNDFEGEATVYDEAAKAGKVYVTVNPSSVDFTGAEMTLVNSQDEESFVTLSPLEPSDKVLSFGFTRAADNGFYEANATIANDKIADNGVGVDVEKMAESLKSAVKNHNASSVTSLAKTFYNEFSAFINVPALAVKAGYTDVINNEEIERNVYSEYGIAAVPVEALTYANLEMVKDQLHINSIPGYSRVDDIINRLVDEANKQFTNALPHIDGFDTEGLTIKHIDQIDPSRFKMTFSISILSDGVNTRAYREIIGGLEYLVIESKVPVDADVDVDISDIIDNGDGSFSADADADATIIYGWKPMMKIALNDEDATADAAGEDYMMDGHLCSTKWNLTITKKVGDINDIIGDIDGNIQLAVDKIKDIIEDVNEQLDQINNIESSFTSSIDNVQSKLMSFLDKVNTKATNFINNFDRFFMPRMIVLADNGAKVASGASKQPTKVNSGSVTLVPTSYTADVIIPVMKKHVAVVDVIKGSESAQKGNSECKTVLNNVNSQSGVNEVLEGNTYKVPVTLKKGYTYVIAYSALDYQGKIAVNKFFVKY